jgi:YfiR/HmsC-like
MKQRTPLVALVLAIACAAPARTAHTVISAAEAMQTRARFVANLIEFVDWPEALQVRSWEVCVFGDGLTDGAHEAIESFRASGHKIHVDHPADARATEACHVVYISDSEAQRRDAILARVRGRPVLTVGDGADFLVAGGMIGFVTVNDTIRFEVNLKAARAAGLTVSSKLLGLAVNVVSY